MKKSSNPWRTISWIFGILLCLIGVLNIFQVHPVTGLFYISLSLIYIPPAEAIIIKRFGFSIPPIIKFIFGVIILWVTLAVGDLAEIYGL